MRYTLAALPGANLLSRLNRVLSKPVRTVLKWQLAAVAAMTLIAWTLVGTPAALSVVAGGAVSVIAGLVSAMVASLSRAKTAGGIMLGALRAEVVKVALALLLLWLVLASWSGVLVPVFLAAFVVTMLIFSMAFFVRDY